MAPTTTALNERERKIANALLGSAKIKAWVSTISGAMLIVAAPFLAELAHVAGAPMARETAMALFAIGCGCILLAIYTRREIALLRIQLQESNFITFAHSMGTATTHLASSKGGNATNHGPLRAA